MSFLNQMVKAIFITLFFLHVLCFDVISSEDGRDFLSFENHGDVKRVLSQFFDSSFDSYLEDVSHYDFWDYQAAIARLFSEYRNDFSKMNGCIETCIEAEQVENDHWLDDLIAFSGRDYVLQNMDSFQNLLYNIHNKHYRSYCLENEKDVVFSEIHYMLTVKEFLNHYLAYVETLSEKQRKLCAKNKNMAEAIIGSMAHPPVQTMRYGRRLGTYLSILHRVQLKPEVIDYVINYPAFSKPFNLIQVIHELRNMKKQ